MKDYTIQWGTEHWAVCLTESMKEGIQPKASMKERDMSFWSSEGATLMWIAPGSYAF